jgi:nicotinamidase-related amidase
MEIYVPASYYQQYDANYSLEYPGEGYGGWKKEPIPIDPGHTAIAIMHAWDNGDLPDAQPLYNVCEYIPRAKKILNGPIPEFLDWIRTSNVKHIHIGSFSEQGVEDLPGYRRTLALAGTEEATESVEPDDTLNKLRQLHTDKVLYGHNMNGVNACMKNRRFALDIADNEDVACTSWQLFCWCREHQISHLIYCGFAINACLMLSPCGMLDMIRRGVMCSILSDLTTGVENRESCRQELHKEYGLWAFSIWGGFVFESADLMRNLSNEEMKNKKLD